MEAATAVALETKEKRERGQGRIWQRGSTFWIQFYDCNGRQRRESARTSDEKIAEKLPRKRIGAKENDILPPPKKSRVLVDELYRDEIAYLEKNSKKTSWVEACWERLEEFFGSRRAREIRRADLEAYQSHRIRAYREKFSEMNERKRLACETLVNKDLAVLRMILYRGHALEKLDSVPPFPPKLQGAMERCGTITQEHFEKMLESCQTDEGWLKTFLTMGYLWGYRVSELLHLRCIRVNLAERIVHLLPRTTKNKRGRAIPISDAEAPMLRSCVAGKNPEDFVFTRSNGKPVLDFSERWDKLVADSNAGHFEMDSAGNKQWYPALVHDLRRTAVTNMLAGGIAAENVRALVGHLSKEMTDRYNRPAMDMLRQARELATARVAGLISNGDNSGTMERAITISAG